MASKPMLMGTTQLEIQQQLRKLWKYISSLISGSVFVVPDIAGLMGVVDTSIVDGSERYVVSVGDSFVLDKNSTEAIDGIAIVATASGTGRWVRKLTPDSKWSRQAVWYINQVSGNDENDGSITGALATFAEFRRRVEPNDVQVDMTVYIGPTGLPATDPVGCNCGGKTLTIEGITGTAYTGTVNTYTKDATLNDGGTLNDAAWTVASYIGQHIVFTSGDCNGMGAWIISDEGGNDARISSIISNEYNTTDVNIPSPGDTFEVQVLPTVYLDPTESLLPAVADFYQINYNGNLRMKFLDVDTPLFDGAFVYNNGKSVAELIAVSGQFYLEGNVNVRDCYGSLLIRYHSTVWAGVFRSIHIEKESSRFIGEVQFSADISGGYDPGLLVSYETELFQTDEIFFYGNFLDEAINLREGATLFSGGSVVAISGDITGTSRFMQVGAGATVLGQMVNFNTVYIAEKTVYLSYSALEIEIDTEAPYYDAQYNVRIGATAGQDNYSPIVLTAGPQSTNIATPVYERLGGAVVDPTDYQPATTFTFAVLVEVDNAQTFELRLYDVTDGAEVAGSVVTTTSATLVELTAAVTLDAAEHIYEVQGRLNTGGGGVDYGRLINAEVRPA